MASNAPVAVAIIDDHPMSAEGLGSRLTAVGLNVVASVHDVKTLSAKPDVVVCDLRLPGLSFGKAIAYLVARDHRVLATSGWASPDVVLEAVGEGARGYLSKEHPTERFAEAITEVADLGYHVSVQLAVYLRADLQYRPLVTGDVGQSERAILDAYADGDLTAEIAARTGRPLIAVQDSLARIFALARLRRHDLHYRPTPREEEVMILAGCAGMSDRKIARQLGISEDTITRHLTHVKEKYKATHPYDLEAAEASPRAVASRWARDLGLCKDLPPAAVPDWMQFGR
jgi:DNA-binding NarL/FixJ family response regulator